MNAHTFKCRSSQWRARSRRHFNTWQELQDAIRAGTFLFLPSYGPATFNCRKCGNGELQTARNSTGTGYALTVNHEMLCYRCADEMQRADMLDRSRPFNCYISGDGKRATTWTGGALGEVVHADYSTNGWHGSRVYSYRVRDVHGNMWHGRNGGAGMCITLRPMKGNGK